VDFDSYLDYVNHRYMEPIYPGSSTNWKCPYCRKGYLIVPKNDFRYEETEQSKGEREHCDWEPEWLRFNFSAFLSCTFCNDKTVVIGTGTVSCYEDPEIGERGCEEVFNPLYFIPVLPLFDVPDSCPEKVKEHLNQSFALAWSDFSGAGNKLRIAVERLVDHLSPHAKGNLHIKIESLKNSYSEVADLLLAIKWLGNDGSHDATLKEHDVAFSYKIFQMALEIIYGNSKKLSGLASLVNSAKGSIAK